MKAIATNVFLFLSMFILWRDPSFAQTTTNPRTPAEFEEVKGVVIRWDEKEYYKIFLNVQSSGWTSYLTDRYVGTMNTQATIVKEALNEGLEVYVIDDTSRTGKYGSWLYSDYHVLDTLIKLGVPSSSHLHIISYPVLDDAIEKVWVRDWGPYSIYNNGVGPISMAGRSLDTTIGKYLQKPFIMTNVMDGGNFMVDGYGRLICDQSQTNIDQALFGISNLVTVANYKLHIDYYMKLINEETFIVNSIPASNHLSGIDTFFGDSVVLEGAIAVMKQRTSPFGRPYKFVRIRTAPTFNQNGITYFTSDASYANSLILNRTVLVPTYDNPSTDSVAINTYKSTMPGYRIVGVPARYYAARQGAIHCITKELAEDNPIFISHAWLPDTTLNNVSQYQIKAYIKTPPSVSHAEVNWTTNPQSGFQSIAMTQTVNDTFVGYIPQQSDGSRLSYYISATANGGKQTVKPVVAPIGYYSTFLKGTSTACLITCPANVTLSNTVGQCGAIVNYPPPTTTGNCGLVTSVPPSGSFFPVGTTIVTCAVASGPSCIFTVTVNDNQKPTIACPSNITVPESSPGSGVAVVNYPTPIVSDNCPGVTVSSVPASGSSFSLGMTIVKSIVQDAAGNRDSCSFTVTVNSPTTCQISCPANIIVNNDVGQCGAIVNYSAPTTTGICGTIASTPTSGAFFSIGTTTVVCSVASGPRCSFTVTVRDIQKPTISCPSNIIASESSSGFGSAIVNYPAPTISDNCPGVSVTTVPASGSSFSLGTTTVKAIVQDASGNKDSCSFTVTVNFLPCVVQSALRDDFNRSNSVLAGTNKWSLLLNHPGGGSVNVVSNAMQATGTTLTSNGVVWDTLIGGGSETSVKVIQKSGNFTNSSLFIYARMNSKDYNTGSGYRLRYWEQSGADLIEIHRVTNGYGNFTVLATTTREINPGDVITFRVLCDNKTMVALVNGVQVLTTTDATYSPPSWYFAMRLYAFTTPVRFDDFTVTSQSSAPFPVFSVLPTSKVFGNVNVATSKVDSVTVTNAGSAALTISSVNSNNVSFAVTPTTGTIAPSGNQKFYITFTPASTGSQSGSISFTHNVTGSPSTVSVSGIGVVPLFSVAPTSIAFSTIFVGTSKQDSVTISNAGTASLVISSITADNGQFNVSPTNATIAPGSNMKFYITFSPTGVVAANGNIIFTHNASGSPGNLSVSGAGGVPVFGVSPLTISYGDVIVGSNKRDSVVVSNNGTVALNILSVISDSSQFTVIPTTGSVPPSGNQKFYVSFNPMSIGAKSGDIIFTHNGSGSPNTVTVNGIGIVSAFSALPSSIAFGNVQVGSPKQDSVTVTNTGGSTLTIISVLTDNAQFIVTPTSGSIAASLSMKFYVTFTPSSSGNKSGNVIFNHSDIGSPSSVPVTGTGIAPIFSVTPSTLPFGNVTLGSNKQDSVTVTNTGNAPLVITSANTDSSQFTVTPSSGTIAPSGSQKFYITFAPVGTGSISGRVNFIHNATGSPGSVTVSGTGVIPGFSVTPSSILFGNVNVTANKKDSVTVTNTGSSTLTISSVGSDNGQFTVTPPSGSLAPSASQKFFITFAPTSASSQSGNITFTHNAFGSPTTIPVSGTGVAPVFAITPSTIGFGNVAVGASKQDSVTVTNTGTAPLVISTVTSNNSQFTVTPTSGTIAPSANQKYYLAFTPTSSGLQSGNISFVHNATGSPGIASVNGTGLLPTTPVITSFTPPTGSIGTPVTINGANFNSISSGNIVYFGAVKANVTSATSTALTVTVPAGASFFPITVEANGFIAYSQVPFIVTFPSSNVINASSLAARVDFAAGNQPFGVSLGDVDGDGKPDIQAANISTLSVMRNTSTVGNITAGSFAPQVVFAAGSDAYIPFMGDLDCDGKLDMVVTNNLGNTVSIFRNISAAGSITTSSFAAPLDLVTGSGPQGVYIRDVDGDGKADLVVANSGSNTVSVWRNIGLPGSIVAGTFATRVDFTTATTPRFIEVGDVNGDGKPDIITPNLTGNNVSVLRNTSTPGSITASSFAAHVDFITGSGPKSCALGDLDGDGKPDLAVAHYNTNTISVLRNTSISGTISFIARVDYVTGNAARSVVMTDISGDGKLDLEVVNQTSGTLSLMRNISTPGTINASSFAAPVNFTTGLKPIFLAVTDFDADGKPDVVINNADNNTVSVFKNTVAAPLGKTVIMDVEDLPTPKTYSLDQNYPNPFNPVTTISYALPENAYVNVVLYNTLGQHIQTLLTGVESAGYKQIQFDAGSLPSGVYFYHLQAVSVVDATRSFSQVKKMVLMR